MKKTAFNEIIFYIILPLVIWRNGRELLGDYYAMLLSTLPGLIYTIYKFFKEKQFSKTGMFILISLLIGTSLDLIADSAEWILWNGVYLNFGFTIFWLITIMIKQPMAMYFFIDYAYLRGIPREESYQLYRKKEIFPYFQYLTAFFAFRDILQAVIKIFLIKRYGVDGFEYILLIMKITSWVFTGLMFLGIYYIIRKINEYVRENKKRAENIAATMRQ
ncbi:hypothetical protein BHF71_07300 [Vulcanibacillus modesticaldus]|uniref:Uncharacterized protein n=1 Tax=Vulcanibacillus modesticaldus TaxID=337097 RepID=A0A1D2YVZ2_9BACI|nr:VC0807 family protein [Vulcanibacillus modesticaldus]OEF99908.1 hypothetical protein BHF71_07300 [Vulcanibacillus modesticaldus]